MATSIRNHQLLVRRPRPAVTESALGYILKLAEKNGYLSPQSVLSRAGIDYNRHNTIDARAMLERITRLAPGELSPIGTHWGETDRKFCRLLGHRIHSAYLQFQQRKVCPECVKDKGFIEAHFDLALVIGCPVHRKLLVTHCPDCSVEIRWQRPGLLKCQCGGALTSKDDSLLLPVVFELLDVVRRKVLHLDLGMDYLSGLPIAQLWNMSLESLLYLIGVLGRRVAGKKDAMKLSDHVRIVLAAAETLANWPHGFNGWLLKLTTEIPHNVKLNVTAEPLSRIYYSLRHGIKSPSDVAFLLRALTAFAEDHFGSGNHDCEHRASVGEFAKRYVSIQVLAEMSGIARQTAVQLIKRHAIPTLEVVHPRSTRTLVDITKVGLMTNRLLKSMF